MPAAQTRSRAFPMAAPQPRAPPSSAPSASPSAPSPPPRAAALHKAGLPQLYDPGLATTQAYTSSLTLTHGASGTLRYRGHPIEALVAGASFDEGAYLLLHGRLPTRPALRAFRAALADRSLCAVPPPVRRAILAFPPGDAHPMPVLCAALCALAAAHPQLDPCVAGQDVYAARGAPDHAVTVVLAVFPALLAAVHAHTSSRQTGYRPSSSSSSSSSSAPRWDGVVQPVHGGSDVTYAQRFLTLARAAAGKPGPPPQEHVALLDTVLLLHADHEQNCSTSAVRHVSSAGASLFASLAAGAGALSGPLHGGAAEAVLAQLEEIGTPAGIAPYLAAVRAGRKKLMGFGHRVYRAADPRARILRARATALAAQGAADDALLDVAVRLEQAARNDPYFVKRQLFPNVDFYSGIVYRAMGFEPRFFTPLFALGRVVGWLAHWKEFLTDPDRRIARPRQHFAGVVGPRPVPRIEDRQEVADDKLEAKL